MNPLAPNAEITVFPWKEPEELKQRTIDRVRRFLKAHVPMRAGARPARRRWRERRYAERATRTPGHLCNRPKHPAG